VLLLLAAPGDAAPISCTCPEGKKQLLATGYFRVPKPELANGGGWKDIVGGYPGVACRPEEPRHRAMKPASPIRKGRSTQGQYHGR